MRSFLACAAMAVTGSVFCAEPDAENVRKLFKSNYYTVTWGTVRTFDPSAELEIGDGAGHGGTLSWIRFQPGKTAVDVLSIKLDEGRKPYKSMWPPDRAPVVVKKATMKPEAYAALLRDLAVVDAAKLEPVKGNLGYGSSNNFWVYARLTSKKETLLDLNWAGYENSSEEATFAKPHAAVHLSREVIKELDFKDHTLTDEERSWASAKFARDWKKFKEADFLWWVRERYIETVGVVGDKAALPTLRDILAVEPPKGEPRKGSEGRCVYLAINAVTRLTKKDVRDKPVEEMDIEKTRLKVLDIIEDKK